MSNHDNEQANARRRLVYAQNINKNIKKQHLLYRDARQSMYMSFSFSLGQPSNTPSLPSPMLNPSNTPLDDAHQQFREKMDQLGDMNVCSICNECYLVIAMKKFHGTNRCSCCIIERKSH